MGLKQGFGFSVTCEESRTHFDLHAAVESAARCRQWRLDSSEIWQLLYKPNCADASEEHLSTEAVFGVGFSPPTQRVLIGSTVYPSGGVELNTITKVAPGCRGIVHRRSCILKPATVKYKVLRTNDTIALRSGAGNGYQLAELAIASPSASANGTAVGNKTTVAQDHIVALNSSHVIGSGMWARFFSILYEPMQVNLTATTHSVGLARLVDCISNVDQAGMYYGSNTNCNPGKRIHRRDLSQEYAVEPYNYSAIADPNKISDTWGRFHAECSIYWRDPMQVRNERQCEFSIKQNSSFTFSASDPKRLHLLCPYLRLRYYCLILICLTAHLDVPHARHITISTYFY